MCMHHELSYLLATADPDDVRLHHRAHHRRSHGGGRLDGRAPRVAAGLVERFEREGWLLTRSYNDELGASSADAFGTDDPPGHRELLPGKQNRLRVATRWWTAHLAATQCGRPSSGHRRPVLVQPNRLPQRMDDGPRSPRIPGRCLRRRRAAVQHPVRDGDPIGEDVVQLLNDAYEANTVREPWRAGDLLLVDNVRTAHSREPFTGPRDIVVGMSDPMTTARSLPTARHRRNPFPCRSSR